MADTPVPVEFTRPSKRSHQSSIARTVQRIAALALFAGMTLVVSSSSARAQDAALNRQSEIRVSARNTISLGSYVRWVGGGAAQPFDGPLYGMWGNTSGYRDRFGWNADLLLLRATKFNGPQLHTEFRGNLRWFPQGANRSSISWFLSPGVTVANNSKVPKTSLMATVGGGITAPDRWIIAANYQPPDRTINRQQVFSGFIEWFAGRENLLIRPRIEVGGTRYRTGLTNPSVASNIHFAGGLGIGWRK
jgi:hypothetical protein